MIDESDEALFDRVRRDGLPSDWRSLDVPRLAAIAAEKGIDYATGVFYLAASAAAPPSVEAEDRVEPFAMTPKLLIVPGAFHRHHTRTGADGLRLGTAAAELGWTSEVLPVGSLSSIRTNAALLIDRLRREDDRPIVLASLSKGSADVAVALRDPNAEKVFKRVCGWISLSGLVHGTPLVGWLRDRPLRLAGVHLLLWSKGLRFAPLGELQRLTGGMLDQDVHLPRRIRAIHVIGCPLRRHLVHPWAVRGYDRLAPLGPNDGGGLLLGDAARLPGVVSPVWGTDHYLNPTWDFAQVVRGLLTRAVSQ